MSETPDIRIVVGADLVKTKSVVGEDLQYISKQINAGKPIANVAIGLDVNGTRKLFEEKLKLITKDIKVDGIKLDLSKAIENKPLDLEINTNNISKQINTEIFNATKNSKITLPKIDSSTKDKKISSIDVTIGKYKKLGEITKENQNEVNKLRQAIIVAEDTATFKNATDNFDIFINKIKLAKVEMKKFDKVSDLKDTGRMYVSSRSKSDTIKNLENQFLAKDAGAKVSIKGTDYIDGDIKAYKELSATVTYSTGEVKKFNFEQAKIGKDIGYIESSSHTIKSVVDGNLKQLDRQKEAVRSMYNELSETNGNDKQVQSLFTKHQGLGVDGLQYTEKIKELQDVYTTVQKAFASKPSNVSENDWFDQNYEKIEGLKVGLKDLLPLFDVAKKELSTSLAITDTSRIGDTKAIKAKNEILDLIHTTEKYRQTNDRLDSNIGLSSGFDNFIAKLRELSNAENISEKEAKELNQEFKRLKNTTQEMGLEGQTFGTRLASQMQKFGVYLTGAGIMYGVWNQIKNTIGNVVELDTATTNLSIATGKSRAEVKELVSSYSELGKELGATTAQVSGAADDWLRQGNTLEDTNKLIKDSLMLSKLGNLGSEESTKALTSATKGYKIAIEDTTSVVDKFTSVDMEAAVSAGYIATAMAETATGARLAGVDIDRLTGYITSVGETTQDGAESVGNFYKTLFARMGNVKEGKLIDPETQEDISNVEKSLSGVGIALRDQKGEFRNFGQVLDETYADWGTYSNVQQRAIAVAFSGTRQQEKFLTLMETYGKAMEYAETSANSAGTAVDKYENTYLKSVAAAQEKFSAQFEQLSATIWNSDLLKGTINTGTGALGALTFIIDKLGSIPTLAASVSGALAFKNIGILKYTENEQGKGKVVNNISKTLKPKLTGGYNSVKNPDSAKFLFETLKKNSSMSVDDAAKVISNLDKTTILYANTVDRTSLSMEGLEEYTKLTSSTFGTLAKNMALNVGVMLAIGVAMKVAVYAFDKANTTFDEQKEKVDGLQKSYEKLKSELDVLEGKNADDLTPAENARLDYLKRRLELEEKLLAIENRKLADSDIYGKGDIFSQGIEGKMTSVKSNSADSKYFVSKDLEELKKVQSEIANLDEGASNYQIYLDALLSKEEKLKEAIEGRTSSLMESEGELRDAYDEIQGYIDSGVYDNDAKEKNKAQSLANSYLEQANSIRDLLADKDFVIGVSVELNESQIADLKNEIKSKLKDSFAGSVDTMSESELKVAIKIEPLDGETPEQWSERIKGIAQTVDVEVNLKTNTGIISYLDEMAKKMSSLDTAYTSFLDKGAFDLSSLSGLTDSFGNIPELKDDFEDFLSTITKSGVTTQEVEDAFSSLAGEYLNTTTILEDVNEATKDNVIYQLEQMGISNAEILVNEQLSGSIDEVAVQKQFATEVGHGLENATYAEVNAFIAEQDASDTANAALARLALAKIDVNNNKISTESDIEQVIALANAAGASKEALNALNAAKASMVKNANPRSKNYDGQQVRYAAEVIDKVESENFDFGFKKLSAADFIKPVYSGSGGASKAKGSGGGSKGGGSKGGGSAKEIEAYKAKIDEYKKLQAELDKIQADISANEKKASNTKDDKEKIALIQQRIILTQKEQTALHNLNNARDEELAKNVKLLKQKGFKVDYNADSNELEIKNLEHLNGLKGAGQEKTNELIKENEELIKSTESLNEANKKGSETWWDSYYNLSKYNEEIEDLNRSIFKDKVEDLDFGTIYYDGIAGQESKIIDIYKDIISKTQTETDREYAKGLTDNDSYVQELIKKRKDYVEKIKSLNKEIYDNEVARQEHIIDLMSKREGTENQQIKIYENMKDNALKKRQELIDDDYALHVDEIQKLEKDWTAYYDNVLNLQKKQLEDKKKLLEGKKDNKDSATSAVNKTIDNEIKRLEKQKDALSKVNEERQKQIDLEKRQMELERAKSQKTSLIYRENRGFDYEADESAIKDAQNALDDFSVSGKQQDEQDALQKEIDSLQEYKEKWNDITNVVTDAQNEQKATMELGSNWKAAILNKDIGKLEDFKDGYVDVETSINDVSKSIEGIVNEMAEHINEDFTRITDIFKDAAESFSELSNSINGTSQRKTYYAKNDGSAPSDAKTGDRVLTQGGTYEITKENTEGSKYNEATGNWSKLIDGLSSKIDKSNAGTLAYTETLAANNLNLQEANKAQTANTEGILGNNLLVRDNSGVVKTNSDDVINNSSTVSDNTSLISESNNWIDNLIETLKESSKEIAKAARSTLDAADRAEKAAAKAKESSKSAGKRHSGGIIGNGIDRHKKLYDLSQYELKPDEELNILQEDEGVFTKEQMDNIIKLIDAPSMLKLDLNSDAFKNFNASPTKLNIPNYEIPDISSIQNNQNKETIYNQSTNIANVNFSDIQEVKQIQEAIITLPQYAKQKSTSDYRK